MGAHDVVFQRWFSTLPTTCYGASLLLYIFQLVRATILLGRTPRSTSTSASAAASRRARIDNSPLVLPLGIVSLDALRILIDLAGLAFRGLVSPHHTPHRYRILRQLLDVTSDALDTWALTILIATYIHVFSTGIGYIRPLPKLETSSQKWIARPISIAEGLNFAAAAIVFVGPEGHERDGTLRLGIGRRVAAAFHVTSLLLLLFSLLPSLVVWFRFPHPTRLPVDDWTRSRHLWTCLATLAGLAYVFVGSFFRALPPLYRAARHLAHPFWTHMTEYWAAEALLFLVVARDRRWKEVQDEWRDRRSEDGLGDDDDDDDEELGEMRELRSEDEWSEEEETRERREKARPILRARSPAPRMMSSP